MKIFELLKYGRQILEESGVEDYDFDAECLLMHVFNFDKNKLYLNRPEEADEGKKNLFLSLIDRRKIGEPLQYIIGKWSFMDGEFFVGEGVLIPRSDTETLVEAVADFIRKHENVKVVCDLCAGSGCIGISIGMLFPDVQVYCVELSDKAFQYLEKNVKHNNVTNVKAVKGDITKGVESFDFNDIDVLVSNPPYIETDKIATLSQEVQNEPHMALDGGKDGLYFYRILAEKWLKFLKKGCFSAFECGEKQAKDLSEIYADFSSQINIHNDLNGIERVVSFTKN